MLQTQQTFLDYLDAVQAELGRAGSGGLQENIQAIERLKQELAEAELIVPVVGAFSAGKSTLINSFLGAGPLSVGITPETALATELRHSASEYVEGIRADGEVDRFDIGEIAEAKVNAQDIDGNRPLHIAAQKDASDAAKVLLSYGSYFHTKNYIGFTPLDIARKHNAHKTVAVLDRRNGITWF